MNFHLENFRTWIFILFTFQINTLQSYIIITIYPCISQYIQPILYHYYNIYMLQYYIIITIYRCISQYYNLSRQALQLKTLILFGTWSFHKLVHTNRPRWTFSPIILQKKKNFQPNHPVSKSALWHGSQI